MADVTVPSPVDYCRPYDKNPRALTLFASPPSLDLSSPASPSSPTPFRDPRRALPTTDRIKVTPLQTAAKRRERRLPTPVREEEARVEG